MKRLKTITAVLLVILLTATFAQVGMIVGYADTFFDDGDFRFAVNRDNTLAVAGYYGSETELTLPERVGDRTVVGVHSKCFRNSAVESVVIPDSYTAIGTSAFQNCSSLKKVHLPLALKSIGLMAFYQCASLQNINFLETAVENIGMFAFSGCTALEAVSFPESLTSISENAFCGCTSLAEVSLPVELKIIGAGAFMNDTALESVFVPDSVTEIGKSAFAPMTDSADFEVRCFENTVAAEYFSQSETANLKVCAKVYGDLNLDGTLDVTDATAVQKHLAELDVYRLAVMLDIADANRDGNIDITDATYIQMKVAGY